MNELDSLRLRIRALEGDLEELRTRYDAGLQAQKEINRTASANLEELTRLRKAPGYGELKIALAHLAGWVRDYTRKHDFAQYPQELIDAERLLDR